jgi:tRNA/rRNA methyltransferase
MPELNFILVQPAREENIGAAARAMNTMGIFRLSIVAPLANHLGERARATAHASNDILESASIFEKLEDAIQDADFVIGSTAKNRNVAEVFHPVENLPEIIIQKGDTIQKVAIVFGGEESGLSNEHLRQCHMLSTIPMYKPYPSLNLAQAVMVYATHLSKISLTHTNTIESQAPIAELPVVRDKARQILEDVELTPENIIYPRIMERLMLMNKDDINLFHSFSKYYLKKYHGRVK